MAGLARDVAALTERRSWGRMAAAASALVLGGYVVAHEFGAPVWWPPYSWGNPIVTELPELNVPLDEATDVEARSGKSFVDTLADGKPCPMCPEMMVVPAGRFLMGSTPSEIRALTKEFPDNVVWFKRRKRYSMR
jgi:hypothetical protein